MPDQIDISNLAAMVRAKRGGLGLRSAAQEIGGVSAATVSRIEQGKVPDFHTYLKICGWLGIQPASNASIVGEGEAVSTVDKMVVHLRADRHLTPDSARALEQMIRQVYDALKSGATEK
ncbi:MAG: helix-turn-helix domain-containing protein [Fimbriimonadaceae bacterium]